ncbi:unnamed protein product [Auanema sp. JU1783]|nr:unnamed protein product [Auanema sp. JU1783]
MSSDNREQLRTPILVVPEAQQGSADAEHELGPLQLGAVQILNSENVGKKLGFNAENLASTSSSVTCEQSRASARKRKQSRPLDFSDGDDQMEESSADTCWAEDGTDMDEEDSLPPQLARLFRTLDKLDAEENPVVVEQHDEDSDDEYEESDDEDERVLEKESTAGEVKPAAIEQRNLLDFEDDDSNDEDGEASDGHEEMNHGEKNTNENDDQNIEKNPEPIRPVVERKFRGKDLSLMTITRLVTSSDEDSNDGDEDEDRNYEKSWENEEQNFPYVQLQSERSERLLNRKRKACGWEPCGTSKVPRRVRTAKSSKKSSSEDYSEPSTSDADRCSEIAGSERGSSDLSVEQPFLEEPSLDRPEIRDSECRWMLELDDDSLREVLEFFPSSPSQKSCVIKHLDTSSYDRLLSVRNTLNPDYEMAITYELLRLKQATRLLVLEAVVSNFLFYSTIKDVDRGFTETWNKMLKASQLIKKLAQQHYSGNHDLRKLFMYKLLEILGLGPKVHFYRNSGQHFGFYTASERVPDYEPIRFRSDATTKISPLYYPVRLLCCCFYLRDLLNDDRNSGVDSDGRLKIVHFGMRSHTHATERQAVNYCSYKGKKSRNDMADKAIENEKNLFQRYSITFEENRDYDQYLTKIKKNVQYITVHCHKLESEGTLFALCLRLVDPNQIPFRL